MIRSFRDMDRLASEKGPKRLVVLAPEDEEGYTQPILIGDREKMEAMAEGALRILRGEETPREYQP